MAIWKFCTFGLKCLFPPPKFRFLGGFYPQTLFFVTETPKRHFLGRNRAFWAIKRRDRSSGLTCTACKEYKKKGRTGRSPEKRDIGPAHAFNPILTIFGMWGGPLDIFLKFEFRFGRSPNFGATGVKNRLFPILDTSLIQQLVATAQAVIRDLIACRPIHLLEDGPTLTIGYTHLPWAIHIWV